MYRGRLLTADPPFDAADGTPSSSGDATEREAGNPREQHLAAFFHDVRAPLSAIQMVVDALEEGVIDEDVLPDHLRRLRLLVERLVTVTGDLIPGDPPRPRRSVSARDLMLDAAAIARPAADLADVSVQVTMIDETIQVLADPAGLGRALDNIVYNAIRHTPAGQLVTLSAWEEHDIVCLAVADGCSGIASAEVDLVFDAGYQGDDCGAAGLGLAIARSLVGDQEGRIDVANEEVGCRFEIRVPRASPAS